MAKHIENSNPSRTFMEYRFLTQLTPKDCTPEKISLKTPLTRYERDKGFESAKIVLNIPFMSAAMQAVTGARLAITLAQEGGIGTHYCSQTIEDEAAKVAEVKNEKAGFVKPETLKPEQTVQEAFKKAKQDGHSIYPVVNPEGILLGSINVNYLRGRLQEAKLGEVMRRFIPESLEDIIERKRRDTNTETEELVKLAREYIPFAYAGIDLREANRIMGNDHKCLTIIRKDGTLDSLVFRKDVQQHINHPNELVDADKRYVTAAALNTHDYKERAAALVQSGVDLLVIDSSDGFTEYQKECIEFCKKNYADTPIMGGNIITAKAFDYLVGAGADVIKVGMGGGSICITQEQKGTGRGQATAVAEVVKARDEYYQKTGIYIPIISDGGHSDAKDMLLALAFGAEAVMLGRVFAGCEESNAPFHPETKRLKQYWGEGHSRARAWREKRYGQTSFNEGVDGLIPYVGKMSENVLADILFKMKATMVSCGTKTTQDLQKTAEIELISEASRVEGKAHDIIIPQNILEYTSKTWGEK